MKSVRRPNDPHEMPRWRFAAREGLYSIRVAGPRASNTTWYRTTPKVRVAKPRGGTTNSNVGARASAASDSMRSVSRS